MEREGGRKRDGERERFKKQTIIGLLKGNKEGG